MQSLAELPSVTTAIVPLVFPETVARPATVVIGTPPPRLPPDDTNHDPAAPLYCNESSVVVLAVGVGGVVTFDGHVSVNVDGLMKKLNDRPFVALIIDSVTLPVIVNANEHVGPAVPAAWPHVDTSMVTAPVVGVTIA